MFKLFAAAEHRPVPVVRYTRVSADNEGEPVAPGSSNEGTGYREYAEAVVRTMRNVSRGFDSVR